MKALLIAALLVISSSAFAGPLCVKATKDTVAAADAECAKEKAGQVCILALEPHACGAPGPAGSACKRDKVCASGKCDAATSKCN